MTIDEQSQQVILDGLLKRQAVPVSDINSYAVTVKTNRFKTFRGLLLELKDKKKIQLAEQNINNLDIELSS